MATLAPVTSLGTRLANAVTATVYNQRVVAACAPVDARYFTSHSADTTVGESIPVDEAQATFRAYVQDGVNASYPVEASSRLHTLLFGEPCGVSLADALPIRTAYATLISAAAGSARGTSVAAAIDRYADAVVNFAMASWSNEAPSGRPATFTIPQLWTGVAAVIRLEITRHFRRGKPIILHDLSNIDFRDVPELDLRRASRERHFACAILDNSNFNGRNCAGFNFSRSSCLGTQFAKTVLSGAIFANATVDDGTNFDRAIGGDEIPG